MRKRLLSIFFALAVLSMSLVYFLPMAFAADSPPVFGSDTSDTTATTGDAFDFEINVTDDYTITNVYVDYWFGAGSHTNTTMSPSGYNYTYSIVIPSGSTDTLHYIFHATIG